MVEITAGKYKAKITDYGLVESKNGNLQVFISFKAEDFSLSYFQTATQDKSKEILALNLVTCGFTGNDLDDLYVDGALDKEKELIIVVKLEPDQKGEMRPRIQFINDPAKSGIKGQLDKKEAISKLRELKMKGFIAEAKSKLGVDDTKSESSESDFDANSIPF